MIPKALEAASSETMGGLGNWRTFKRFVAVFSTSEEQDVGPNSTEVAWDHY